MSIAEKITPHIPYLRRYARALTGSQEGGDAYVVATLEALAANPTSIHGHGDLRVLLYKTFSSIWQGLSVNMRSQQAAGGWEASAHRHLEAITPKPRQAFLLMSVEGFTLGQTADILGVTAEEASELIEIAGTELADQVATDVLIIEDEPIIAMDIEALVSNLGHRVIGIARTHKEALEAVRARRPGLVLADIQLADGSSGLDAVNEMLDMIELPVIFITAYPERLLTGERPEPTFLITKPFQPDSVKAVISQVLFFDTKARLRQDRAAS